MEGDMSFETIVCPSCNARPRNSRPVGKVVPTSTNELLQMWEFGSVLGKGHAKTEVRIAKSRTDGSVYACKIMKKKHLKPADIVRCRDEINILSNTFHPHIITFHSCLEDSERIFLFLELMTGGDLFEKIVKEQQLSEHLVRQHVRCLLYTVDYLHSLHVVHRDIKPENILFSQAGPMADFGLAKHLLPDQEYMTTPCGTAHYAAPEILNGNHFDKAVDLWSMGVMVYAMLCGFMPFANTTTKELYAQIKLGKYTFPEPFWSSISDAAKDFVARLLIVDPTQRVTTSQALRHSWISSASASMEPLPSPMLLNHTPRDQLKIQFGHMVQTFRAAGNAQQQQQQAPVIAPANAPVLKPLDVSDTGIWGRRHNKRPESHEEQQQKRRED